jgi:hypothetical protein
MARQNRSGTVAVSEGVLTCEPGTAAWLFSSDGGTRWAAGVNGQPGPVHLRIPGGTVEIESMSTGTIVWNDGVVTVDALDLRGSPTITGGRLA